MKLAAALVIALAACGGSSKPAAHPTAPTPQVTQPPPTFKPPKQKIELDNPPPDDPDHPPTPPEDPPDPPVG